MESENIHQPIRIYYECVKAYTFGGKKFNFFELAYVLSGSGYQQINGNKVPFKTGDLLIITPNDHHASRLSCLSEFLIIRFDKSYINSYQWMSIDHIECILYHASHMTVPILQDKSDSEMVASCMQSLLQTIQKEDVYNEDLQRNLVNTLIVIAARNIAKIKPHKLIRNADKRILQIIDYLQAHIYKPKALKASVIANSFGLSQSYLGGYFYKHSGETLQQYIANYRMRLIEHRLRFSDKRIGEIVEEFGFVDESHINKFFKKHQGMSLKAYRLKK